MGDIEYHINDAGEVMEAHQEEQPASFAPGVVLVKFKSTNDANAAIDEVKIKKEKGAPNLTKLFTTFKVDKADRLSASVSAERIVKFTAPLDAEGTKELMRSFAADPSVEYAELDAIVHTTMIPTDPFYATAGAWGQNYGDMWGLQKMAMESAWDITQGNGVTVAVIDTGVDLTHEDLVGNLWTNAGESSCTDAIDNDQNGYIDDCNGWNFVSGTKNPTDDHGHGTHVSGTIAAVANNGKGIVGVAPQARIMALKGLDINGSGLMSGLVSAIYYAADNGADVINASWGGSGPTPQTLIDALAYAHDVKDVVFVAAAGNSATEIGSQAQGFYPANIRSSITVSAYDHTDTIAYFSNRGVKVDVAAPGGGDTDATGLIIQPIRSILSAKAALAGSSMTSNGVLVVASQYVRQAGTSMAAPHVAGAAALVRALHPEFNAEQVRQALRQGANDVSTPGFDTNAGYGRVNALGALGISEPLATHITGPTAATITGVTQIPVTGTAHGSGFANWLLEYGTGTAPTNWSLVSTSNTPVMQGTLATWNVSTIADGAYTLRLTSSTASGAVSQDRLSVTIDQVKIDTPSPLSETVYRGGSMIQILGTVASSNFANYSIRVLNANGVALVNPAITLANNGTQKVWNGLLGQWNTAGVPAGHYTISLQVTPISGSVITKSASVLVDPTLRAGWPQTILLGGGNSVYADQLTVADINNDGKKEILAAYGPKVSIYREDGTFLPGWPQTVDPTATGKKTTTGPVVGDLDGDGSPEIVASNNAAYLYIWHADGTVMTGWPRFMPGAPDASFTIADVNGDGINEIIGVTKYSGHVWVLNKEGIQLPGWPKNVFGVNVNSFTGPAVIGDVLGTGKKQIIVMANKAPSALYVLSSTGMVQPGWPKQINASASTGSVSLANIVLGDVNTDGILDIVAPAMDGRVHALDGYGNLLPGWPQTTASAPAHTPTIGDLDGDGTNEVIVGTDRYVLGGLTTQSLFAWHGNGSVVTGWPVQNSQIPGKSSWTSFGFGAPIMADIDNDGKSDVIVAADIFNMADNKALHAYRYNGTSIPGFPKLSQATGAGPAATPAIADLDGNGTLELAWVDSKTSIFVWDLPAPSTNKQPWPMFQHDAAHTGRLDAPDTRAPNLNITSPSNGLLFSGSLLTVSATATDTNGVSRVDFFIDADATPAGTDTSNPYSAALNVSALSEGSHLFGAKAYDSVGNMATASGVTVTLDRTAPAVALTQPADGSTASGSITISATASDINDIAMVEFTLDGSILLGTTITAPYELQWDTSGTSNGPHTVTAKAYDRAGNTTMSASRTVTVQSPDSVLPTVSLTAPLNGASLRGTIQTSATASDDIGVTKVEFYKDADAIPYAMVTSSPYDASLDTTTLADGSHTLFAKAYDAANNSAVSSSVSVTVDNTAPVISGTTASGITGTTATISWTTNEAADTQVEYGLTTAYGNSTTLNTSQVTSHSELLSGLTAFTLYHYRVKSKDALGNLAISSNSTFTTADATAPAVSVSAPANGALVQGTITVSAIASDNVGVTKVEFYKDADAIPYATDTSSPYDASINTTTVTDGSHSLTAKAYDAANNVTTSTAVTVTVDNTGPVLSGTTASSITHSSATVTWTSNEASDSQVEYGLTTSYGNSTAVNAPLVTSHSQGLTGLAPETLYHYRVKSKDAASNLTTTGDFTFTTPAAPDVTAPTASISAPANGAFLKGTITVSANASDNVGVTKVEFYKDADAVPYATDTSSPYDASLDTTTLTDGAHTLTVKAFDAAGNVTTSATVSVTVDNTLPSVTITSPSNNARVSRNTTVTIAANASDAIGVTKVEFLVNNVLKCTDTISPYTCAWAVPSGPNINYSLQAKVYDAAGNTATHTISVKSR